MRTRLNLTTVNARTGRWGTVPLRAGVPLPRGVVRHHEELALSDEHGALVVHQLRVVQRWPDESTVAEFLMRRPKWRSVVRRVQTLQHYPYGEIRDNLIGKACRPIDLLRCKLSFFGATGFDPRSDLWTRITMYQGAPLPHELASAKADDWSFPCPGN